MPLINEKDFAVPEELPAPDPGAAPALARLATVLALGLAAFQLYTSLAPPWDPYAKRSMHVAFVLALAFVATPSKHRWGRFADLLFALAAAVSAMYVFFQFPAFTLQRAIPLPHEAVLGAILTLLVLEATRRTSGLSLPIVAVVSLLYGVFGHLLPNPWKHPEMSLIEIGSYLYTKDSGLWGSITGVSGGLLAGFVMFGAFLSQSGIHTIFGNLGLAVGGRMVGGPAQVAVISSALFGMVSGSGTANVLTTGTFTIPLMIRVGFSRAFAAAVEAVASSGGMIMPPIMGIAAFMMAEMLDLPYLTIAIAALIPAVLYFVAVAVAVYLEARTLNLKALPEHEIPRLGQVLRTGWVQLLPFVVLVGGILWGMSIPMAAFFGMVAVVVCSRLTKHPMGLASIIKALETGSYNLIMVGAAVFCAAVIMGTLGMTGLGLKVTQVIITLSGSQMVLALLWTVVAAIILGMGLPAVAAYVLAASSAGPVLILLGVPPLVAHMFVFFFAMMGGLTPPVCIVVYAAAALAQTRWLPVAWIACRLALPSFILGFMMVFNQALLMRGAPADILRASVTALIGVCCFAVGLHGTLVRALPWWQRVMLIAAALLLIDGGLRTDLAGLALAAAVVAVHVGVRRSTRAAAARIKSPGAD